MDDFKIGHNRCNAEGCRFPRWSKGYCKMHQRFAPGYVKPPPLHIKRKGTAKTFRFGYSTEIEVFQKVIYDTPQPVLCAISGVNITDYFTQDASIWVSCCHHVLGKGRFPAFKLYPPNILLIHPDVHHIIHFCAKSTWRKRNPEWNWDLLDNLHATLKKQYEEYSKEPKYAERPSDSLTVGADQQTGA